MVPVRSERERCRVCSERVAPGSDPVLRGWCRKERVCDGACVVQDFLWKLSLVADMTSRSTVEGQDDCLVDLNTARRVLGPDGERHIAVCLLCRRVYADGECDTVEESGTGASEGGVVESRGDELQNGEEGGGSIPPVIPVLPVGQKGGKVEKPQRGEPVQKAVRQSLVGKPGLATPKQGVSAVKAEQIVSQPSESAVLLSVSGVRRAVEDLRRDVLKQVQTLTQVVQNASECRACEARTSKDGQIERAWEREKAQAEKLVAELIQKHKSELNRADQLVSELKRADQLVSELRAKLDSLDRDREDLLRKEQERLLREQERAEAKEVVRQEREQQKQQKQEQEQREHRERRARRRVEEGRTGHSSRGERGKRPKSALHAFFYG
ncbi:hypothetical protein JX266_009141 [Neoarthrinium moseri]|nr:hypothetical protein JX266_009141 [Neoarthrinium moseri]